MKKLCLGLVVVTLLVTSGINVPSVSVSYAENGDNFICSALSNSIWILNKSTKKLMFVKFLEADELWKSYPVIVPSSFDLEKCMLESVGSRGGSVFLCDRSSGMTTLYQVKKDRSVQQFLVVNTGEDLK